MRKKATFILTKSLTRAIILSYLRVKNNTERMTQNDENPYFCSPARRDVLVCFQHYDTFEEAKKKWDERKKRVDYDHIGYIFHVRGPEYQFEAEEFFAMS